MQRFTALFLTGLCFSLTPSFGQETVQDWSRKVIELQAKEGQNFEQDVQLVKGFLYLQRRSEALTLLNRLMKASGKRDSRLIELYETASDQFFLQDTAETYTDAIQLIKEERWAEAKEKIEQALQKESKHRLLTLRAVQLALILTQNDLLNENSKNAESSFSESPIWKIFSAWISLSKSETKEAYRTLSSLRISDKKLFEKTEVAILAYLQAIDATKYSADWAQLSKIIQKHPEWVGVRMWRLKNKSFAAADRKKEYEQLKVLFSDLVKLKKQRETEEKENSFYFLGLISIEKLKTEFDELMK